MVAAPGVAFESHLRAALTSESTGTKVYTIGHSTRSIESFLELLRTHGIRHVVDVRTIPRSRHNPQFNRESLPGSLRTAGIVYSHMPELGGLRRARKDSTNTGWRNASFRGFADYMQTEEFEAGLARLIALAEREPTAILCAEAVPWRCHRSLIADALAARGVGAKHITGPGPSQPHALTQFARVEGARVRYPADP
jgi:uncharacterized protein (DUF488 family)